MLRPALNPLGMHYCSPRCLPCPAGTPDGLCEEQHLSPPELQKCSLLIHSLQDLPGHVIDPTLKAFMKPSPSPQPAL